MIQYVEKGYGMHLSIREAGFQLEGIDDIWHSNNDVEVQKIIDNYSIQDAISYVKKEIGIYALNAYVIAASTILDGAQRDSIRNSYAESANAHNGLVDAMTDFSSVCNYDFSTNWPA